MPHVSRALQISQSCGLSAGRMVESANLSLTEHARGVERFTRTGPKEITYDFRVEDPTLFTQA